jgi:exopolysaccharide production protein ExoQ
MRCLVAPETHGNAVDELPHEPALRERHKLRQTAAGLYLGVLFFALSKGPLFQARQRIGEVHGDFIDDHLVQATFSLIYIAGLVMYRGLWPTLQRCRAFILALAALCLVLLASTIWSYAPWRSGQQSAMFALGTGACVVVGSRARPTTVLAALAASQQVGTLLGRWAIHRHWPGAVGTTGYWQGVYYNRNSYGMTSTLAFVATAVVVLVLIFSIAQPRSATSRLLASVLVCVLAGCLAVDVTVIRNTRSLTPAGGVIVAVAVAFFIALLPRAWRQRRSAPYVVTFVCVAGGAFGWQLALTLRDRLSRSIGRTPDLAGRTPIWATVREYFWQRPVGGWGFFAVWLQPAIHKELLTKTYDVFEAHAGYYEVAVGAGFVGIFALAAALGMCIHFCSVAACRDTGFGRLWPIPVAMFVLSVNVTETYFAANVLPWALLVVVSSGSTAQFGNAPTGPGDQRS